MVQIESQRKSLKDQIAAEERTIPAIGRAQRKSDYTKKSSTSSKEIETTKSTKEIKSTSTKIEKKASESVKFYRIK